MSFALNNNAYPHSLQFRLQTGHKPSHGLSAECTTAFKTQNLDETISAHLQNENIRIRTGATIEHHAVE